MPAAGLKSYILNNNLKAGLLLAGFPVLLILLVFGVELAVLGALDAGLAEAFTLATQGMIAAAPVALAVAGIWFVIAYFGQQKIVDVITGARKVERTHAPELYNLVENLAISRGIRTPAVRVIEHDDLNAFATGLHEGQYSITVTRGLLSRLDREEVEAVIGHELSHILNRDVRLMVICAVFAGIISLIGELLFRGLTWSGERMKKAGLIPLVLGLVIVGAAMALAFVLRMAVSRNAELLADAGSVDLTKNPDAMVRALRKIGANPFTRGPAEIRALYFENPRRRRLMATHPPIQDRIDALVKVAGAQAETESGPPFMS